jgi:hypothetical protein
VSYHHDDQAGDGHLYKLLSHGLSHGFIEAAAMARVMALMLSSSSCYQSSHSINAIDPALMLWLQVDG